MCRLMQLPERSSCSKSPCKSGGNRPLARRRNLQVEGYRTTRIPLPVGPMTKEHRSGVTLIEILIAVIPA